MSSLWKTVKGHAIPKARLLSGIRSGHLPHLMIFAGPSGVGKNLLAQALAQILLCRTEDPLACGQCDACIRVIKGQHESLLKVEPDGGQIKVEQARAVRQWLTLRSLSRNRVIIIDPADWLNIQGANVLLKVFEEPPANTFFILVTAAAMALPSTVRSRAQMIRFGSLMDAEVLQLLRESTDAKKGIDYTGVAKLARGSIGRAKKFAGQAQSIVDFNEAIKRYVQASRTGLAIKEVQELKELLADRESQNHLSTQLLQETIASAAGEDSIFYGYPTENILSLADRFTGLEQALQRGFDKSLLLEELSLELSRNA